MYAVQYSLRVVGIAYEQRQSLDVHRRAQIAVAKHVTA